MSFLIKIIPLFFCSFIQLAETRDFSKNIELTEVGKSIVGLIDGKSVVTSVETFNDDRRLFIKITLLEGRIVVYDCIKTILESGYFSRPLLEFLPRQSRKENVLQRIKDQLSFFVSEFLLAFSLVMENSVGRKLIEDILYNAKVYDPLIVFSYDFIKKIGPIDPNNIKDDLKNKLPKELKPLFIADDEETVAIVNYLENICNFFIDKRKRKLTKHFISLGFGKEIEYTGFLIDKFGIPVKDGNGHVLIKKQRPESDVTLFHELNHYRQAYWGK
jgi:hypothetical protein